MSVRVEVQPNVLEWARTRSGIEDETWLTRLPRYEAWLEASPDCHTPFVSSEA